MKTSRNGARSEPRKGITRPLPPELHPAIRQGLRNLGIEALYLHQAQAWESVFWGQNIAIVTGTASGKTYCYSLPVLQKLLLAPTAHALYIFPTKALAQDQLEQHNSPVTGWRVGSLRYSGCHLRRRHACCCPRRATRQNTPADHQPGYAPHGDSASPPYSWGFFPQTSNSS